MMVKLTKQFHISTEKTNILLIKVKVKVNWVRILSVHPEVPISFSLAIGLGYSIYNVVVGGSPVLRTTSLLPSQPKPVPIYTPESRGAS